MTGSTGWIHFTNQKGALIDTLKRGGGGGRPSQPQARQGSREGQSPTLVSGTNGTSAEHLDPERDLTTFPTLLIS